MTPSAVLLFVGAMVGGNTPNTDASPQKVVAYYTSHRGHQQAGVFLIVYAIVFGLFFATSLRSYLRERSAGEALAGLGVTGMTVPTVAASTSAGVNFAAADVPGKLSPTTMQALNVLQNDVFFGLLIGAGVFYLANGIAILKSASLPRWLGWVALPLGILAFTPIGWIPVIFGFPFWASIVRVPMFARREAPAGAPAAVAG